MATALRTMTLGSATYPVVLPKLSDPRLHLAAVIISVHILGQTVLGFRVSVPQILAAILTCALIEVGWTFVARREIVWPASAMLTGSGVALILRLVGMERGEHWSWRGWSLYASIAGLSLVSKYLIRYRGSHLFNPSNVGLVAAFLVLGSDVIEPLDFWWSPLTPGMLAAYAIIIVGGLLITARLRLLAMATAFWLSLAAGLGVVSISGHCITAAWALTPVCGADFWWVVMGSPELLVFLFFMITDPKTIPSGPRARIIFALALGAACALLMAPQSTEFGAKVGLLAGLVVLTAWRHWIDRFTQTVDLSTDALARQWPRPFLHGVALGAFLVVLATGIVVAGTPARAEPAQNVGAAQVPTVDVDLSSLPEVTVDDEVASLNSSAAADPEALAIDLAEALEIEARAVLTGDTSLLRAVCEGERLVEMERAVQSAAARGRFVVADYDFGSLHIDVIFLDGPQGGASLAIAARGERTEIEYDSEGAEVGRVSVPFSTVFVLSPGNGQRWLISAEIDAMKKAQHHAAVMM